MLENESSAMSHKNYFLQPACGRSHIVGNVRFATGSQDRSSVQLIKADSKAFEGLEMANVDAVFADSKVSAFFSSITPRAQAGPGWDCDTKYMTISRYERGRRSSSLVPSLDR